MEVQGKTAIVMGGGSGIGRATALALANHGAAVAVGDLQAERVEGVVQEIKETGQQALGSVVDVTQREQVKEVVRKTLEAFKRIDILVNSAGIFPHATVQEVEEEEWDKVIAVNLKGTFLPCKEVLGHMIAQKGGRIINISAGHAARGIPFAAHYAASKAGVNALTKSLALEGAPYGILVNAVAPGRWTLRCPAEEGSIRRKISGDWVHSFRWVGLEHPRSLPPWSSFWLPMNVSGLPVRSFIITAAILCWDNPFRFRL